jgi:hypothetical protein
MSILPELLAQMFGQPAVDELRDSKKTIAPPAEGDTNVSLGAVSGVFGSIGLLLGASVALGVALRPPSLEASFGATAILAAIGLTCSWVGIHSGRSAPSVARRHPGAARYGVVVSAIGMVLSVASLVVSIARALH